MIKAPWPLILATDCYFVTRLVNVSSHENVKVVSKMCTSGVFYDWGQSRAHVRCGMAGYVIVYIFCVNVAILGPEGMSQHQPN